MLGDFSMPVLLNSFFERISSLSCFNPSPSLVVIPIADSAVWVKTNDSGVAIYNPSKTPLTVANSTVYSCALLVSSGD